MTESAQPLWSAVKGRVLNRHAVQGGAALSFVAMVVLAWWHGPTAQVSASESVARDGIAWVTQYGPGQEVAAASSDPETLLREVNFRLASGERAQALSLAQELVRRWPNFQLGQLLYADLLNWVAPQPQDVSRWLDASEQARQRLTQLRLEARLRLDRPDVQTFAGKEPLGLAYLSPRLPFVVVVDASLARLYVLAHRPEARSGSARLAVVHESYMSVGHHGIGKQAEGDGRTPLGVYTIQKYMPGYALPDLYGAGAFTLNYPNDIDQLQGKTGSGIWIHGSPSAQYARPPEATDGCVVVANPDMQNLVQLQLPLGTPVLIQSHIEWVSPERNRELQQSLARLQAVPEPAGQTDFGQPLAVMSWHSDGRQMAAAVGALEPAAPGRVSNATPTYWLQQDGRWTLASARLGKRLLASARAGRAVWGDLPRLSPSSLQ